jgi:hypothetical protein
MHDDHLDPMVDDPPGAPAAILATWNAKEDLLDVLELARTPPDRHVVADRLFRLYDRCAASGLPQLERLATTVQTSWPEICAFIKAGSGGANRMIKTVARDSDGFRNPA